MFRNYQRYNFQNEVRNGDVGFKAISAYVKMTCFHQGTDANLNNLFS